MATEDCRRILGDMSRWGGGWWGGPGVNIPPLGLWQLRIAVGFRDLVVRPPNPMVGCYFFRIAVGFGDLL